MAGATREELITYVLPVLTLAVWLPFLPQWWPVLYRAGRAAWNGVNENPMLQPWLVPAVLAGIMYAQQWMVAW